MTISRYADALAPNGGNNTSKYLGDGAGSDTATLSLSLRIIYTLNSSSQPLLARVKRKSPAIPVSNDDTPDQTNMKHSFGKVLLKTCLAAVCASSPELLGNPLRDYSIYIVDPLEDISGLSVGVGLLSWWLKNDRSPFCIDGDNDNDYAMGKIVTDRGTESLEIVMSLKETIPQSAEDHARSLSFLRLSPSDPSQTASTDISSPDKFILKHSTKDTSKIRTGRPSGATTNPEKKARRVALLEQKETLKRLQNLAKMQRGEPYDSTLILPSDANAPKVTEEDIERQQKVMQDLELRPVASRQTTSLLTTKPLPARTTNPSNLTSSGGIHKTFGQSSGDTPSLVRNKRTPSTQASASSAPDIGALPSLLTSMLGRIDSTPARPTAKGKEIESPINIDPTIIASLGQLLPFLIARPEFSTTGHDKASSSMFQSQQPWNCPTPASSLLSRAYRGLFQTADETFHISNASSPQLTGNMPKNLSNNYTFAKSDPPKVREDAYPVPGGGWARGRNLVPRAPVTLDTIIPDQQSSTKSITSLETNATSGKENEPPSNMNQGVKRGSVAISDKEANSCKHNTKKRKAEKSCPGDVNAKLTGVRRANSVAVGLAQKDENIISHAASSPLRSTSTWVRTLSEPNFQGSSAPLIATSDFPFSEEPRTPKNNPINFVEKSLFTPATPVNKIAHTNGICTEASLFTPNPVLARSQESAERSILHPAAIDSEPFTMKPGWDLPPSSPPPPTSPISSPADLNVEDALISSSHELAQDTERNELRYGLDSPVLVSSARSSEFEELSEIPESSQLSLTDDIGLDIDELWSSLGPIIVQAQTDNAGSTESDCTVSRVIADSQNGIDAAKLAEDLKALFGGCIV